MTAMQTLEHLVNLKRKATTTDAVDRYAVALYAATSRWIGTTAAARISVLAYDALIDHIAHETSQEGTRDDLSVEHAPDGYPWETGVSKPADRRTA